MNQMVNSTSIKTRLLLVIVAALVGMLAVSTFALMSEKSTMLDDRKVKTRHLVEAAYGVLVHYYDLQKTGALSEEAAKDAAIKDIKAMRYGQNDYFWLNDFTAPIPRMVMHPTVSALDGKILDSEKFNCATSLQAGLDGTVEKTDGKKNLFVAFNEVANKAGSGFVTYNWPKPKAGGGTTDELYSKLSYVKKFDGWNWLIGSGIYIDDVESIFWQRATWLITIVLFVAVLIGSLMLVLTRSITAISERLGKSNAELEEANQRLQKLDQMKSDFLSSVSHELRTPLTSIRGFSQLIDREFTRSFAPLAEEDAGLQKKSVRIQENLKIILKESERLTRLINDVLDLAKIEAGHTNWHDAPLQAAVLIKDAAGAAHGMFEQKPAIELRLEIEEGLPLFIGDADRMQQVLVNLINNAVKFTDQGMVTVKVFLNPEAQIQIEVRDSGIGFPQEEAEAIFDKFQQAKQGDTLQDRPKGTGLGLAICREIVNRHGGRIWAQSQPGKGSVFSLILPPAAESLVKTVEITARIAAFADGERTAAGAISGKVGKPKVLVVDDDLAVCNYFSQLLQEQGYEVITAPDGQAALVAARSHQPDLITMDLSMPVMDGRTAISLLRADTELKRIPIMVISAIPGWEAAGGDVAMSKPLDETRFVENIHLLLNDAAASGAAEPKKVHFLVLYQEGQPPAMVPGGFAAYCEVGFCPVNELSARIQAGFQGMVAIPADLLNQVDIGFINATPSLEVMIMPVPAMGVAASLIQVTQHPQETKQGEHL
ncbi:MAG: cache domain-containing protein [Sulfuricella sp.]|nr:cache domain-containing protein [Sulfuricella sp.]